MRSLVGSGFSEMKWRRLAVWIPLWLLLGCGEAPDPRPSIALVVVDTLRADAVSAYGEVEGTTPHLDRLAAEGLLYQRAFATAPWTITAHASLFTGLEPDRHGVGIHGVMVAPETLVMLAERLRDAGYQTAGFSENTYITEDFGMAQGFETFAGQTVA
ncbi:unnamed protein product, partial [marine sediment metagenome]